MCKAAWFAILIILGCGGVDYGSVGSPIDSGAPRVWYVDPLNGNDTNSGTDIDHALKSAATAISRAHQDDVVNLRGTADYPATTLLAVWGGTAGHPITVQSWPGDSMHIAETAVFDPGIPQFKDPVLGQGPWQLCYQIPGTTLWSNAACKCTQPQLMGNAEEYISTDTFDGLTDSGTMLDSNTRLLSYSRVEDLCADNESDVVVPMSDSRPAGGELCVNQDTNTTACGGTTGTKRPWTYRGPGLWWDDTSKHVHIRLSHTHLATPGVSDYAGNTNPNTARLSITSRDTITLFNHASHIAFKNIVFQNGGDNMVWSFTSTTVQELTFDHCTFQGGRIVVSTQGSGYRFTNCGFSALLGSWVSREDVKEKYKYLPPPPAQVGVFNGRANTTADVLMTTNPMDDGLEVANCEFRDGHDGIQVWGTNARVHDSLFENLNDEVFFLDEHNVTDLRIYSNVIRKGLDVFSHATGSGMATPTTGARYYFRNIIDNRLPTLGFHRLASDNQPIWRFGADFKMDGNSGEFYAYQNTFIQAFPGLNTLSSVFGNGNNFDPANPRSHRFINNIHITFDGNAPLYSIPADATLQLSDGNVWVRRTTTITTELYAPHGTPLPSTFDVHSSFAYPGLANVPDFGLPYSVPFPNADYRLTTPSVKGVNISMETWGGQSPPDTYPQVPPPMLPEVGALPFNFGVVLVGIDGRQQFPAPGLPIAEAGDYTTVTDTNGDGFETIAFDGTASADPGGSITSYTWTYGLAGPVVATTATFSKAYPTGRHQLFLTVTDNDGNAAMDMREILVVDLDPNTNLIQNPGWDSGATSWTLSAGASVTHVGTHYGSGALDLAGGTSIREADQVVPITAGSSLTLSAWMRASSLPTGKLARLQIEWLDAFGTSLGVQTASTIGNQATYVYRSMPVTAPTGAAQAKIKAVLDAGTTGAHAFFDDARLRR